MKVKLDTHKPGKSTSPVNSTNYYINGPYKDTGKSCSTWYRFSVAGRALDFTYIESGDT